MSVTTRPVEDYLNPKWFSGDSEKWQSFVGDRTIMIWHTLTDYQRIAIGMDAQEKYDNYLMELENETN